MYSKEITQITIYLPPALEEDEDDVGYDADWPRLRDEHARVLARLFTRLVNLTTIKSSADIALQHIMRAAFALRPCLKLKEFGEEEVPGAISMLSLDYFLNCEDRQKVSHLGLALAKGHLPSLEKLKIHTALWEEDMHLLHDAILRVIWPLLPNWSLSLGFIF